MEKEELRKSMCIIKILREIMHSLNRNAVHEFRNMNLTAPQSMVVGILAHHGDMKISDLSKKLNLSNSTISGIVDRLEKQGYVERTRSKKDRRVVLVKVTSEFKKISKQKFDDFGKNITSKMGVCSDEELNKVLDGLKFLRDKLK